MEKIFKKGEKVTIKKNQKANGKDVSGKSLTVAKEYKLRRGMGYVHIDCIDWDNKPCTINIHLLEGVGYDEDGLLIWENNQ